jgi:hypothetical protein
MSSLDLKAAVRFVRGGGGRHRSVRGARRAAGDGNRPLLIRTIGGAPPSPRASTSEGTQECHRREPAGVFPPPVTNDSRR